MNRSVHCAIYVLPAYKKMKFPLRSLNSVRSRLGVTVYENAGGIEHDGTLCRRGISFAFYFAIDSLISDSEDDDRWIPSAFLRQIDGELRP